jgi:hypothetical protein
MKKIVLVLLITIFTLSVKAQDSVKKDTAWKFGGLFALTISQTAFSDWAAGGEPSYSANGRLGLFANYEKGKTLWENNLDVAYGKSKQGDNDIRKTDDILEFNSKFGYKAGKKWYYSAVLNAKTQLDDGFDYSDADSAILISEFMAPFYLNLALGLDYKPNKYTSVFISPLNLKTVYVSDSKYALRYSIDSNGHVKNDFGAIIKFKYQKEVIKNMNFLTKLDLFSKYNLETMADIDVNWEVLVTFKVFKVLSVNLNTLLIWDNDVRWDNGAGENETVTRIQFKEIFGAGIAYNF